MDDCCLGSMRTIAPAKINWTLEVLGRRDDGYHEIRSVMQTIDLCDELSAERSSMSVFETVEGRQLAEDDLIVRAAKALEDRVSRALPVRIRVEKRIPLASGLGGGSSDAAATLRLLNHLHGIGLSSEDLAGVGAAVGSDVPFFVYGGTALVEGRGERVTPLPDVATAWFTIVVPTVNLPDKTQGMYARLTAADYTNGSPTNRVAATVSSGRRVNEIDTVNVFDRHTHDIVDGLEHLSHGMYMEELCEVHAVGAGPSIFAYCDNSATADSLAEYTELLTGDARASKVPDSFLKADTFVARTLTAVEATAVTD
jgi:4-diphosphocytidyl-2-C-methyl-D-erythritol kinase